MNWVVIAFFCATAEAAKDTASKIALRQTDPITLGLISFLIPWPYFVLRASAEPLPILGPLFGYALVGQVTFFALSVYLYQRALATSELSLTVPLICFTPIFFLITSPLIVNEHFSSIGVIGMVFIVAGAYSLYLKGGASGAFGPLKNLAREKGARLMLTVAFIWSVTGSLDRLAILHSNAVFWAAAQLTCVVTLLLGARLALRRTAPLFTPINFAVGTTNGLSVFFYFWAMSLQKVGYVVSVKRFSVLMAVLIGHYLFNEANLRARFFGATLMLVGLVCISLAK